jgi:hypothetical protein
VTRCGYGFVGECTNLAEVWLGNSVTTIGGYAFAYADKLFEIFLPDSITSLDSDVFRSSPIAVISISGGLTGIDPEVFHYSYDWWYDAPPTLQELHLRGPASASLCAAIAELPSAVSLYASGVSGNTICSDRAVTGEAPRTIRATKGVPPTRPATNTPIESRTPSPYRSAKATAQLDAVPDRVIVADNQPIDVAALNQSRPIAIGGTGVLQSGTEELWLTVVQIEPAARLIAKDLTVQASLHLQSGATLTAAPLDKITLIPEVELEFRCGKVQELPHLDLGEIGDGYAVVPSVLTVVIGSSSTSDDVHKPIVQGRTLGNCDEWKKKVTGLPSGYEAKCETISSSSRSLMANGDVIGLFVVKEKDGGLSGGAIAGIVIAVLVVVAAAAVAVWFFVLRKRDDSGGGASA